MSKKKWMSGLLAAALAFTTVFSTGFTAKADEGNTSADKITVFVAAEGKDAEGNVVNTGKLAIVADEGSTVEDAAKEAFDSNGVTYDITESSYGAYVNGIGNITAPADWTKGYWSFWVNGKYSDHGISQTVLKDNDKISFVFAYGDYATATGAAIYADDPAKNPDSKASAKLLTNAKAQQDVLADAIYQQMFGDGTVYGIEQPNALYAAFSLIRAGYKADDYFNKMYEKTASQLQELKDKGTVTVDGEEKDFDTLVGGYPEFAYAKIVLFVTAMGKDAKSIRGFDLIEAMAKKSNYDNTVADMRDATMLLAFDSGNYQLPTGNDYITKAQLVKNVTGQVGTAIAKVATASTWSTVDDVAMPLQALYPYISGDASAAATKAAVRGIHFMESLQNQKGAYTAWGSDNNAWSLAQVMTAMGQLRINPCDESDGSDFIKEGNTVLDAASAFVNVEKKTVDKDLMGYQPEQLLRGLNAVIRVMDGEDSLYDVSSLDKVADQPKEVPSTSPAVSASTIPAVSTAPTTVPTAAPSKQPVTTASAQPSETPVTGETTAPSSTPVVSQTPVTTPATTQSPVGSATTAPTKAPAKNTATASKVKKIKVTKKVVTVKKGKKASLKWNVTTSKNASIKKLVKVTVNKKAVKVVKTAVKKKNATVTQVTVTVKGQKKGKAYVTLKAGSKSAKVKVTVK